MRLLPTLALLLLPALCQAEITSIPWGTTRDNAAVTLYTLKNAQGMSASFATYGATLVSLKTPDKEKQLADVVLGFDSLQGYLKFHPFFGATVGRYANRIRGAAFKLEGADVKITPTERGNTLHGGRRGFDKVVWAGKVIDEQTLELSYTSADGEEGFPGELKTTLLVSLSNENELKLDYAATTTKTTVVNLTNHSYFNLQGHPPSPATMPASTQPAARTPIPTIESHTLFVDAEQYIPIDLVSLPRGPLAPVEGTPFDFRSAHPISDHLNEQHPQLLIPRGYDHCLVLTSKPGLRLAATLHDPASGRTMDLLTTEPGLQVYTGNGLNGTAGKGSSSYPRFSAVCLESEHFPDSPNHPEYPSTVLHPNETFHSMTVYRFSAH